MVFKSRQRATRSQVSRQRGFTLIELLIVVAIIGILATVALPKFAASQVDAQRGAVRASLRNIEDAAEMYRVKYKAYPPSVQAMTPSVSDSELPTGVEKSEFEATLKRYPGDEYGIGEDGIATYTANDGGPVIITLDNFEELKGHIK